MSMSDLLIHLYHTSYQYGPAFMGVSQSREAPRAQLREQLVSEGIPIKCQLPQPSLPKGLFILTPRAKAA
jgi:hypothetical protein